MSTNLIARAATTIEASTHEVWNALTTPAAIRKYMFGTDVESQWRPGSPITWKGEWQGRSYEDRGQILEFEPERRISYSHYSPLSGQPDLPENYHTVTIELTADGDRTHVTLTQDNNTSEQAREHSEKNWSMMLDALKDFLEK